MRKSHKLGVFNFDIITSLLYENTQWSTKIFANTTACSEGLVKKHFQQGEGTFRLTSKLQNPTTSTLYFPPENVGSLAPGKC